MGQAWTRGKSYTFFKDRPGQNCDLNEYYIYGPSCWVTFDKSLNLPGLSFLIYQMKSLGQFLKTPYSSQIFQANDIHGLTAHDVDISTLKERGIHDFWATDIRT